MSGRDKDKGKAHAVDHGKPKKNKNRKIDVSSDPTRQWVRPTGVIIRNIDERTGTPIPTATTPPPYSTPFPTIPSTPFPPNPPAPCPPILPASVPAITTTSQATTSQPPTYSTPSFAMPGFTLPSTHSPRYNTTPYNVRQGFDTSVPSPSSMELMQDLMQTGNFLALLADQRPPQQQQQQQHQQQQPQQQQQQQNNQSEEAPSGGDQQRRQRRQIIEDWEYVDNLVVVTPTPETLEPSHGVSEPIRMAIQTFYPKDRRWAVIQILLLMTGMPFLNTFRIFVDGNLIITLL